MRKVLKGAALVVFFVVAFAISWLVSSMSIARPEAIFNQPSEAFTILHFPDDSDDGMLTVYILEIEQIVDTLVPGMYAIGGMRIGTMPLYIWYHSIWSLLQDLLRGTIY